MTRKPPKGKSLAEVNLELAKEWHPHKNGLLSPYDVGVGSRVKIWWNCNKGDDHEWFSAVRDRSDNRGCPICAGKKIVFSNCLATVNPKLSKHPVHGLLVFITRMQQDPLDKDALMENVEHDAQVLADLVQTFQASWPKNLATMRECARTRDARTLASETHHVLGSLV